jgi:hypothetical protein
MKNAGSKASSRSPGLIYDQFFYPAAFRCTHRLPRLRCVLHTKKGKPVNLSDIFPRESIENIFDVGVLIKTRTRKDLPEISLLKSSCMVEIGGGVWDRYVHKNPHCDPQALAPFFRDRSPKIYLAMERHTGLRVLKDICYTTADIKDDKLNETQCGELLLAVTWPNLLRISDVTFANPYKSIPDADKRYKFQNFKGLGLFPELLKNCENYCNTEGVSEITLSAAYIDLVPFFEAYGFSVEDTPAGKASLEYMQGIPMHKVM